MLNAAPEHGLNLIRRLVDHAIAAKSGGREPVEDGVTLVFPAGARFFPWKRSYLWSRWADDCYAVQSGLLALEAWAHARIERGDPAEQVLVDILGPEGSPAAFLLVAVDILISHWPKTMSAAVPFLGSPELLSLDRNRQIHDEMPEMDLGGWGAISPREPMGPVQSADLRQRPSRRWALEGLLATFAVDESADRGALQALLADASARLGPPEPEDNFAEPRFMARYALNLVEPANWRQTERGREYVSPSEEAQHLANLQNRQAAQTLEVAIQASIQAALEDAGRSSPQLAEQAVASAQRLSTMADTSEDARHSRISVIIPAAMILARDGADALLDQHEDWARQVFAQAFASTEYISVSRTRDGIRFNPVAIAALGVIHLWRRRGRDADLDTLFELAVRDDPRAAQGFGAGLTILHDANSRLVPALLRCALSAQIRPTQNWDDPDEQKAASQARHRERVLAAIKAELAWLSGIGPEPAWPTLPSRMISVRRSLKIGDGGHRARPDSSEAAERGVPVAERRHMDSTTDARLRRCGPGVDSRLRQCLRRLDSRGERGRARTGRRDR